MREEKKHKMCDLFELLYGYADLRDELAESLVTLEYIQAEIGYALEELRDEMNTVEKHLEASSKRLYRFRKPTLPVPREEENPVENCQ